MPVVSRIFSSVKYPSLCRSCECESLSLVVGQPVGWPCPHCLPQQSMTCLEHYTVSNVVLLFGPSGLLSQRVGLALACDLCLASQGPEVMIGNSVLEQVATHNQTLPNNTKDPCSACETGWCFWSLGPAHYQCLPIFTMVLIWAGSWCESPLPAAASGHTHGR